MEIHARTLDRRLLVPQRPRCDSNLLQFLSGALALGVDVGSTTVKTIVVDPETTEILYARYERHETRQAEKVLEQTAGHRPRVPGRTDPELPPLRDRRTARAS